MYEHIFVPVDNSEHSVTCVDLAVELGKQFDSELTGSHAYAARMHDYRFKQMEFTLPEEYLVEDEMEKQRRVHDTLITMGLELISDSYLVQMEEKCEEAGVPFQPKMYDGKNWKVITEDVKESDYDLVVIGALGLGAVKDSVLGSVCERVVRRIRTDALVVKNTDPVEDQLKWNGHGEVSHESGGNIVVGIDGSPESFAGLKTAIGLGKELDKEVEAVSVYDPYLHYAMFNSIVDVLTEEASQVFKFEEQEQLHEEVIDTGLAKIYQSHLEVAHQVAEDEGVDLKTTLLDGKAFEKMLQYVRREDPWLLVLGRIGAHSDQDMTIGSNTENLLRKVDCNVLLSSQRYKPPLDVQAEESMTWTQPAEDLLETAPDFAQGIAKTTTHRWAVERGHSVITRKVIEEAMSTILPDSAMKEMGIIAEEAAKQEIESDGEDTYVCGECGYVARGFDPEQCAVCEAPGEVFEKLDKETLEELAPLEEATEFETFDEVELEWSSGAREMLRTAPNGYQRRRARARIEKSARVRGLSTITGDLVQEVAGEVLEDTRNLDEKGDLGTQADENEEPEADAKPADGPVQEGDFSWTPDAWERLQEVPEGFMRDRTQDRIEEVAEDRDATLITLDIAEEGLELGRQMMEEAIRKQKEEGNDS